MRRLLIAIVIALIVLGLCLYALYAVFLTTPLGSRVSGDGGGSAAGTAASGTTGAARAQLPELIRKRGGLIITLPENMPVEPPGSTAGPGSTGSETAALPRFGVPVACVIGQDCWVLSYTDRDATVGEHKDYRCGPRSYDGHQGTDFAIGGIRAMNNGIQVLAAEKGKVVGARDGVEDAPYKGANLPGAERPTGESCGNWIQIDHGGGWMTRYCHLKNGSISAKVGDEVTRGQVIAAIGLSGMTRIPHLHFEVTKDDAKVDPFVGLEGQPGQCEAGRAPLWNEAALGTIKYEPSFILDVGIAVGKPTSERALDGKYVETTLPAGSPSLSVWVYLVGARKGDEVRFRISGPDKTPVLNKDTIIDQGYASWFGYAGVPRQGAAFEPGTYTGFVQVIRKVNNSAEVYVRPVRIEIEAQ